MSHISEARAVINGSPKPTRPGASAAQPAEREEEDTKPYMAAKAALATFASGRRHQRSIVSTNNTLSTGIGGGGNTKSTNSLSANNNSSTTGGTSGTVLRYRTDLDKVVLHFMFERMPQKTEEIIVQNSNLTDDRYLDTGVGAWNFFWMSVVRIRNVFSTAEFRLLDNQIINHFPNHYELTRKDLMYKNIKRYLRDAQLSGQQKKLTLTIATNWSTAAVGGGGGSASPNEGSFRRLSSCASVNGAVHGSAAGVRTYVFAEGVPITYNLPNDMSMFIEEFKRHPGATWIVKPTSRSQGKGIFLINRIQQLMRWMKDKKEAEREANASALAHPSGLGTGRLGNSSPPPPPPQALNKEMQNMLGGFIVSKYIDNPLLIGGRKFDLRLYALVTSFKPLVAYLHRDGFARFCATRYVSDCFSEDALGAHLTNVALQKGDEHYNTTHGGKWSFRNVFLYIQSRYGAYVAEGLMNSIEFLIYHSLKAMDSVMFNDKHSFELYGYDILIDGNIKPHLIEVNASPSLSVTTTSDRLMKEEVLSDAMKIVIPPGYPSSKAMPYWEYRTRTDITANIKTGFKLLQF